MLDLPYRNFNCLLSNLLPLLVLFKCTRCFVLLNNPLDPNLGYKSIETVNQQRVIFFLQNCNQQLVAPGL